MTNHPTSRKRTRCITGGFAAEAERIFSLPIDDRTSRLGGYGPGGEVIYEAHPAGCPSVLVDSRPGATATYMSNGSIGLVVRIQGGMEIHVLDSSFEPVEKRQINAPSNNVWLEVTSARSRHIASLINPSANVNGRPESIRVVKLGDPDRSMWYCATFRPAPGVAYQTAVKFSLATTDAGPALLRQICVRNIGSRTLSGNLWTAFTLHGTQRFVYNKPLWYDCGLPLGPCEVVVSCTVPYTDIVQIKRFSSEATGARPVQATADYATFVGDTAADITMPQAVLAGRMLKGGAGDRLTRFSTASVAANRFAISLAAGRSATVRQSLLYVTDESIIRRYARLSSFSIPTYKEMSKTFAAAGRHVLNATPAAGRIAAQAASPKTARAAAGHTAAHPPFELDLPAQRRVGFYANSLWTGVQELYENCRAHGAKLANGIELGTRDRAQDMWPKMKEDPARVRADLVHALGLMYVTDDSFPADGRRLSIVQKLHGMFPRQYPSRWDNRSEVVMCDNRPYTDSPLWLINATNMYIRETGDVSILSEEVTSVHLTDPQHPITSGIFGCQRRFKLVEAIREIFACFARHIADSPYGLCQIMYGDWCDPVDMFGTNPVGDPATRGHGRGAGLRLSAHVFQCLIETIDTLEAPRVAAYLNERGLMPDLAAWKSLASNLRQNVIKWAWEDGRPARGGHAGFVSYIHELKADGSVPDYSSGDMGYTLGSMRKDREFDGLPRRDLTTNAYGLNMLATQRDYLAPVDGRERMIDGLLATADKLFFHDKLGLLLFTTPIPNSDTARRLVGRMGIVPSGAAENGEYHHAQVMMHLFRVRLSAERDGLVDTAWAQFKPMLSAMRDESLAGPFEMPATSYASDPADPHFGKGMYFGLSGSTDWLIEMFQAVAGLELSLHDDRRPALRITPRLPAEIRKTLTFQRIIHAADGRGRYRPIPFTLSIRRESGGPKATGTLCTINGRAAERPEIMDISAFDRIEIQIVYRQGE